MKVLGIDPGYERVGVAILEKNPKKKEVLLFSDCIQTSSKDVFEKRLLDIGEALEQIITKHKPQAVAIEKLYFKSNQKTAMPVAEARGVMRYIAAMHRLPLYEYTPPEIKAAVSGDGHASKDQLMRMVPRLVQIEKHIQFDDEYDAIAVGLTCLACMPSIQIGEQK